MKMKPPANSNSPTSRKKPRIMRHLVFVSPKTQSGISGAAEEIQPHQHLIGVFRPGVPPPLFFGWRRQASSSAPGVAFQGHPEKHDTRKTKCVDHAFERPARSSPT